MLRALTGVIAWPFSSMAQNRKNNLRARLDAAAEKGARLDQRCKASHLRIVLSVTPYRRPVPQ